MKCFKSGWLAPTELALVQRRVLSGDANLGVGGSREGGEGLYNPFPAGDSSPFYSSLLDAAVSSTGPHLYGKKGRRAKTRGPPFPRRAHVASHHHLRLASSSSSTLCENNRPPAYMIFVIISDRPSSRK